MFTIDIILKMSPIPVSVQRKDEESAKALYQSITQAMQANPTLIELTCDKQLDKKVAIFSDQISAVVVSDKTGAAAAGRAPGFLAIGEI